MTQKLINSYEQFGDGIIYGITHDNINNFVSVRLHVMNALNNYEWEFIEIQFLDVIHFRFILNENIPNTIIMNALIVEDKEEDTIILDFYPLENPELSIDEKSDFLIKCRKLTFKIIENQRAI